jgi:hypothetical protein
MFSANTSYPAESGTGASFGYIKKRFRLSENIFGQQPVYDCMREMQGFHENTAVI